MDRRIGGAAGLIALIFAAESVRCQPEFAVEAAVSFYHLSYNEDVPSPLKSSETGMLPGYRIAGFYEGRAVPLYGAFLFGYSAGTTDYDGTTQDGSPLKLTSKHVLRRVEGDAGYTFARVGGSSVWLIPYTGLGYRSWDRMLGDTDPRGLREYYSWWYVPLGFRLGIQAEKRVEVVVDISARFMFSGHTQFDYGHEDPMLNSPSGDLGSQTGWKIYLPVEYEISPQVSVLGGPWFEASSIGMSNHVTVTQSGTAVLDVYEPSSSTSLVGFDAAVRVRL